MTSRRKCRLWWPTNLSSQTRSNSSFLFGWFISSEASLDIIVAFASDESICSSSITHSCLQELVQVTIKTMPTFLQNKCKFSLLGHCESDFNANGQSVTFGNESNDKNRHIKEEPNSGTVNQGRWSCGCHKFDKFSEPDVLSALKSMYIKLANGRSTIGGTVYTIPKLDHMHWNGEELFQLDLHVIIYEIPTFGGHHYSLGVQGPFNRDASPCKKPKWFDDLHKKLPQTDLDTVILALNSVNTARIVFNSQLHVESSTRFQIIFMVTTFFWKLFAVTVASLSTTVYILLQYSRILFSSVSHPFINTILEKLFSNTWQNIQVRCSQLFHWPIFLQDHDRRSRSCVEFAEKSSFHKHLMWSNIVVDILLGYILGFGLFFMAEPACLWVSNFCHDVTNYWLRTGCVWLMGNPAGFKLNTELAAVLGMISLNAIQIWSTLWVFMGILVIYFAKGLSICGILFGLTTAEALIIDMISLVTTHVFTLHLFMSLIYSTQIQAIAALWRLFRGQKWNPLRERLDSYAYTVEQHVVGSLLFTPTLLLLPTTLAFYIFFTSLYTFVSCISILIEVTITIIHVTPYAKIFLRLKRKERFPCGIWFQVTSLQKHSKNGDDSGSNLVSVLHSNYLNLGEVIWPHYIYLYSSFCGSSIATSAHGLLIGRSIPHVFGAGLPPKLPWIVTPWREYWRLCYTAVYACGKDDAHYYVRL